MTLARTTPTTARGTGRVVIGVKVGRAASHGSNARTRDMGCQGSLARGAGPNALGTGTNGERQRARTGGSSRRENSALHEPGFFLGTAARKATRGVLSGSPKEKIVRARSARRRRVERRDPSDPSPPFQSVSQAVPASLSAIHPSATPQLTGPSRPPAPAWSRSHRASHGAGGSTRSSSCVAPGRARAPTRPCRSAHCTSRCC
jgi:hypothetical protein